jgi:hypothetical protein
MATKAQSAHYAHMNWYPKWVSVLCPVGHAVTSFSLDKTWGGSMTEAECAAYQTGRDNVYDRLAKKCFEDDQREAALASGMSEGEWLEEQAIAKAGAQ